MTKRQQLRSDVINWNVRFPLDRDYRKKNNIAFGSEEHRKISQADIYFQFLEDQVYEEILTEAKEEVKMAKEYKEGKWLKDETFDSQKELDLFDQLDVSKIPSSLQIED
jgi:hypothetical protein